MKKNGGIFMKKAWMCRVVIPGKEPQTQRFATLAQAKLAMRQKITDSIDVTKYLSFLEPEVAAVLGKYLSDPTSPKRKRICRKITTIRIVMN